MPWKSNDDKTKHEPDSDFIRPDPNHGIIHKPGTHKVHLPGHIFTATHGNDSLRVTQPLFSHNDNGFETQKDEIWVFGCSYTYGWSLNDDETFPWLLQKELPDFRVINFGMCGFSTIQSLYQLRHAIKIRKKPKYVILAHSHSHDKRNALTRSWKKIAEPSLRAFKTLSFPYGKIDGEGNLVIKKTGMFYKHFPMMKQSALAHFLETKCNRLQEWLCKTHKITRAVMEEFQKTCEDNGIKMVIGGLDNSISTKNMLIYCKREGISIVDMALEISDSNNIKLLYAMSASLLANKHFANKLACFITSHEYKIMNKKSKRSRNRTRRNGELQMQLS
ncbi:MAG: hypothetical protein WD267_13995 [Balneolales bacterium]